ncbi:MAG: 2-hydroxychromene-2-carboxylate isomerase [Kofleriaceae bacterium]
MLELWFDFSCPFAYLASQKAPGLARAAGVELAWRPMPLGGVFRGIGAGEGPMATLGGAKAAHNLRDMRRWAEIFGVPFQVPQRHPMRTVRALRVLLGLPHGCWGAAIAALFAAYWQRAEDVTQDAVLEAALRDAGVPAHDLAAAIAGAGSDAIKAELRRRTDEAIALGIFGAPAWILRDRASAPGAPLLIWGQDRLPWVEAALAGWDPDREPPPGGARPFGHDVIAFRSPHALDVYFDVASPYSYFALTQLRALARVTGTTPRLHPILLGGLFRDLGQVDVPLLAMPPPKQRYVSAEMRRWAHWWGVPFDMPRRFPQRTITAQRLCVLAAEQGFTQGTELATALARAMWAEQRDLEDPDTLRAILASTGLPPGWLERTAEPEVKAALVRETTAAKHAGLFGVPSFVVGGAGGDHGVWGQDRLDLVVRYLAGWEVP